MKAFDIIVDNSENIVIRDGDFLVGPSDNQHVRHLFRANPGQYRVSPGIGIGIESALNGPLRPVAVESLIRVNLERDGYLVISVSVSLRSGINVNAERIK